MARETGSGDRAERSPSNTSARSSSSDRSSSSRTNTGSRDTVASRAAGETAAGGSSTAARNSGSRDTVVSRAEGNRTAIAHSGSSDNSSSSTRLPVSRDLLMPAANTGSRDTVASRDAGRRTVESRGAPGGSTRNQSNMGPAGFDALMAQLDATTTPKSAAAARLLTDPGALDAMMAAGFPTGAVDGLGDWLGEQNDYRKGRIAERQEAGVVPSEGPINWNAVLYDLNAPMRERGVEFEGPVDWGGIGNAIGDAFGGIGEAFSAPAPRLVTPLRDIPANNGGMVERTKPQGIVDEQTGFVLDPETGTYYRPDFLPPTDRLAAEGPYPVQQQPPPFFPGPNLSGFDALGPLGQGIEAEWHRLDAGGNGLPLNPNMPRPRPDRAGEVPVQPAMAVDPWTAPATAMPPSNTNPAPAELLEGMVPGARAIQPAAAEEPTVWDRAVDMAGGAMENTLLGGAVKSLFPDFWYGAGETFKGGGSGLGAQRLQDQGDGYDYWGDPTSPRQAHQGSSDDGNGSYKGREQLVGFVDLNGNGIDDRLEGYTPPPVGQPSVPPRINYGNAVFPDMPPYRPGVDDEWQYFRPQGYAAGGLVEYAEGGEVAAVASQSPNGTPPIGGLDPRITIIADAEDALEGESPNPEEAIALFIQSFGPEALEMLKAQVRSGMTLRGHQRKKPRMSARFIEGPGGPTDDAIPAVIDGEQPAALSDGEFVLPAAAVRGAGDGDRDKGAVKLEQLSAMLAGRGE